MPSKYNFTNITITFGQYSMIFVSAFWKNEHLYVVHNQLQPAWPEQIYLWALTRWMICRISVSPLLLNSNLQLPLVKHNLLATITLAWAYTFVSANDICERGLINLFDLSNIFVSTKLEARNLWGHYVQYVLCAAKRQDKIKESQNNYK